MFSFTSLLLEWLKVGGLRRRKQGGTKTHSSGCAPKRRRGGGGGGGKWPFHPPLFAFREREIHSWARIYCLPHGQSQGEEREGDGRPGPPQKTWLQQSRFISPLSLRQKLCPSLQPSGPRRIGQKEKVQFKFFLLFSGWERRGKRAGFISTFSGAQFLSAKGGPPLLIFCALYLKIPGRTARMVQFFPKQKSVKLISF